MVTLAGFASIKADEIVGFYVHPDWVTMRCRQWRASSAVQKNRYCCRRWHIEPFYIEASLSGLPFYLAQGYRVVCRRTADTRGGLIIDVADLEKDV